MFQLLDMESIEKRDLVTDSEAKTLMGDLESLLSISDVITSAIRLEELSREVGLEDDNYSMMLLDTIGLDLEEEKKEENKEKGFFGKLLEKVKAFVKAVIDKIIKIIKWIISKLKSLLNLNGAKGTITDLLAHSFYSKVKVDIHIKYLISINEFSFLAFSEFNKITETLLNDTYDKDNFNELTTGRLKVEFVKNVHSKLSREQLASEVMKRVGIVNDVDNKDALKQATIAIKYLGKLKYDLTVIDFKDAKKVNLDFKKQSMSFNNSENYDLFIKNPEFKDNIDSLKEKYIDEKALEALEKSYKKDIEKMIKTLEDETKVFEEFSKKQEEFIKKASNGNLEDVKDKIEGIKLAIKVLGQSTGIMSSAIIPGVENTFGLINTALGKDDKKEEEK